MRKVLLVLLICLINQFVIAQRNGSLVTTTGETLQGKIYLQLEDMRVDELILKVGKDKSSYKAHKVLAVYMDNGDTIKTIKYNKRYQFAEVVVSGPFLSYYKIADVAQERKELTLTLLVKQDDSSLEIGNIGFKNRLTKFLNDCPEVADKVDAGEYKKSQLEEIVMSYNQVKVRNQRPIMTLNEEEVAEEQPALDELISKISNSEINDKVDVIEMLEDVKSKLQSGDKIPKYLKGAILEALSANEELTKAFEAAIQ